MAAEDAEVEVPPTLKALLAARLDQLDEAERRVLERGSVEGEIFHRGAVQALAPEETQVTTRLAALVRHQLVRPDRAQLAGRRRLPLPPPADPRRRLRRAPQGGPRRPARPLRRLARRARRRARRARRDRRLPPRAGRPLPRRARTARPRPRRPRRRCDSPPPAGARSTAWTTGPAPRCSPARSSSCDRTGSTSRSSSRPPGCTATSICVRQPRRRKRSPNVPRPRATIPGRCSRVRWPSHGRSFGGEPDATDEVIALCRAALPLEEERGDPRRLALLWELLAAAANFQHAERRRRRSLAAGAPLPAPRRRLPVRDASWSGR